MAIDPLPRRPLRRRGDPPPRIERGPVNLYLDKDLYARFVARCNQSDSGSPSRQIERMIRAALEST